MVKAKQHQHLSEDSNSETEVNNDPTTDQLASNQLAIPESQNLFQNTSNPEEDDNNNADEFNELNLQLTQYIGGPLTTKRTPPPPEDNGGTIDTEVKKFTAYYLELTDLIDRGESHLSALNRAVEGKRIPAKLRISIISMVLMKDDNEFQKEWADMKLQAETALINVLRKHLTERVINPSRDKIRALTRETFYELRKIAPNPEVGKIIDETLKDAESQ